MGFFTKGKWLLAAAVVLPVLVSAQPLERESDAYVAAEPPFEYAGVYPVNGVAAAACPDEDDTLSFQTALSNRDKAEFTYLVDVRECLPIFSGSHGEVIGATIGSSRQLRVRFNYLHKYRNQQPVELYLEVWSLRGAGGRHDRLDDVFERIMARHPRFGENFENSD